MDARLKQYIAFTLCCLAIIVSTFFYSCDTECDKAFRQLSQCCAADGNDCPKLYAQTYIDAGYPDIGPDASFDAGMVIEVPCEGTWLDYARNLLEKGLDPKNCTIKP